MHTLDGGLADGAFVLDGVALCPRRVDDEVHLLVQDDVEDVGAAFGNLVHHFALHAGLLVELGGTFGGVNLEAELLEFLTDFDSLCGEVHLVGKADEHSAFGREQGTGGFLALVVSEGVVVGEAEDFTGGAHFGAENRVHLRELVEGEHGFLGTVMLELLVLELEVFELFAEHEAGREAGPWRPFGSFANMNLRYRLTLAFDDSLRRVAYGSRACYKPWRPEAPCGKILLWAFPHIYVRSGYILWVARFTPFPPNLIKRSLASINSNTRLPRVSAPRGHYP